MAMIALSSASTALSALETELDVIANNLANINTDGFKSSRANFQTLLYQERAQPGVENARGDQRPTGIYVGLGTRISGTQVNFQQGPLEQTDRKLDLAILGRGFFPVEVDTDLGDGIGYTRAGNFTLNSAGEIVLVTDQGRRLTPPIVVPEDATNLDVLGDGTVLAQLPGQANPEEIGQIEIALFVNPAGLRQLGENLFLPTLASGDALLGEATVGGRGKIQQGMLETSNTDPVKELVNLIRTQRAFEYNSQSIKAADEVLQTVGRLRGF